LSRDHRGNADWRSKLVDLDADEWVIAVPVGDLRHGQDFVVGVQLQPLRVPEAFGLRDSLS
jgi:hypothetical protein